MPHLLTTDAVALPDVRARAGDFLQLARPAPAVRFAIVRSDAVARWLFAASVIYLPALWIAMALDRQ